MKQHEQYWKDTTLRHPKIDSSFAYHDRDLKAYEAGANGIVVSREYEELTVPNLRAVGRALVNWEKRQTVWANRRAAR